MRGALDEFEIGPGKTTIPFHRRMMDASQFIHADFDIHYVERMLKSEASPTTSRSG
jgi:biotin carboxylase